jgi:hypothetical protein
MSNDSKSLSATVRRQLHDGMPPAMVVEELVGRGLSRVTAERFVERALAEGESPASNTSRGDRVAAPPPAVSSREPHATTDTGSVSLQDATGDLIRGGLSLAAGIAIIMLSAHTPRGRLLVGLVIWPLWMFGRGVYRCTQLDEPFPLHRVLLAAAIPACVLIALGVYPGSQKIHDLIRVSAEKRAAADEARTREAQQEARAAQEKKDRQAAMAAAWAASPTGRTARALEQIREGDPAAQCEGVLELGRLEAHDRTTLLESVAKSESARHARACAAQALVTLGATHRVLPLYMTWAAGTDPDLRRAALEGFGEIGPKDNYPAVVSFLKRSLKSPDAEVRRLASTALSRIQPPVVQDASNGQ